MRTTFDGAMYIGHFTQQMRKSLRVSDHAHNNMVEL